MTPIRLSIFVGALLTIPLVAAGETAGQGDPSSAGPAKEGAQKTKRWRPSPPPATPEEAEDPRVAEAMRAAPPFPQKGAPYTGRGEAMRAARAIQKRVPGFARFRSAIALASWRVDPSHVWRVRSTSQCHADLRAQGVRFKRYEPDPEDPVDVHPTPSPVILRNPIEGVRFVSYRGPLLVSCELAARLPVMARIVKANGVNRVVIASHWRPSPRTSFHTMGLGLDIPTMWLKAPVKGPEGRMSKALKVKTDFVETPNTRTCDPSLLGAASIHKTNERGRVLLQIACDLFKSGAFTSVLTPNYNPGHRDHFHIDTRPDDPRVYVR